jgi:hypothetical protein
LTGELCDTIRPVTLPRMNDRLGITPISEHVPLCRQFMAQRLEIEYFTVEDDGDASILIIHRLVAAKGIDNCQPPMAQTEARLAMKTFPVGTAMHQRIGHPRNQMPGRLLPFIAKQQTGYTAHLTAPSIDQPHAASPSKSSTSPRWPPATSLAHVIAGSRVPRRPVKAGRSSMPKPASRVPLPATACINNRIASPIGAGIVIPLRQTTWFQEIGISP